MTLQEFQQSIREGIPAELPAPKPYDPEVNHAPKRKDILTKEEKKLAIRNALRYFEPRHHAVLAREFAEELEKYGHTKKRIIIKMAIPKFFKRSFCKFITYTTYPYYNNYNADF